tara:strand:+ start:327 stop:596 length:270 start_codon:yes stop_codon:yes gene_type:complete
MKLTKARLQQIIKEEIQESEADAMRGHAGQFKVRPGGGLEPIGKTIKLSLTQKEANDLLIALEAVKQTPEIKALYKKILDAGLDGGFRE